MNAIVFLTVKPHDNIIKCKNILQNKLNYETFIIADDNTYISNEKNIIKIDENECKQHGYINSGGCSNGVWSDDENIWKSYNIKNPSAWDKALYYFCEKETKYKNVWFIEDDVFIPELSILNRLDKAYENSDFLCESSYVNITGKNKDWPFWTYSDGKFDLPWFKSMISICRMSKNLLEKIKEYVKINKKLFFDEIFFITLAYKKKLKVNNPKELKGVSHPVQMNFKSWTIDKLDINTIYHPIKNIDDHEKFRKILIKDKTQIQINEIVGGYKKIKIDYNF